MCKTSAPFIIGIIIGLIAFILLVLTVSLFCKSRLEILMNKIISYVITSDDRRRAKKVHTLNKITGLMNPIRFRMIETRSKPLNYMIKVQRMKLKKELTGDEPTYGQICIKSVDKDIEYLQILEDRVENSSHNMLGRPRMPLPIEDDTKYVYSTSNKPL